MTLVNSQAIREGTPETLFRGAVKIIHTESIQHRGPSNTGRDAQGPNILYPLNQNLNSR